MHVGVSCYLTLSAGSLKPFQRLGFPERPRMLITNRAQRSMPNSSDQSLNQRKRVGRLVFSVLLAVLSLLAAVSVSFAQSTSSTLRGVVKDPKGAIIPSEIGRAHV